MDDVRDHTTSFDPSAPGRLHELDALRGLAAVSVALMHFKHVWTTVPEHPLPHGAQLAVGALKIFCAGGEAVILFFVLSGLVLALPYQTGRSQPYPTYLLRRVLRIYGPYVFALAIAVAGDFFLGPHLIHRGALAEAWTQPLHARLVGAHVLMLGTYDTGQYDLVLWSLVQEMRISIFFPLLVLAVMRLSTLMALLAGLGLSAITILILRGAGGADSSGSVFLTVHFAGLFVVGILVARNLSRIRKYWHDSPPARRWILGAITLAAYFGDGLAVTLVSKHLPPVFLSYDNRNILAAWVTAVGAVGFIAIGTSSGPVRHFLNRRVPQLLGRISYSLYLIHPIVLLSVTALCYGRVPWWVQFFLYAGGTLGLSWGFCVVVEERFIALSRSVGSRRRAKSIPSGAEAH